jgi:hypothetical protein
MKQLLSRSIAALAVASAAVFAPAAHAVIGYADVELSYFDSGAGPIPGPYGGRGGAFAVAVPVSVVLGTDVAGSEAFLAFDLASIGFTDPVVAIRIVGLDNGGGSPGFDVVNVQVLPGSVGPGGRLPEPASPAPAGCALAAGAALTGRRRQR